MNDSSALAIWRRKLQFLQVEEAKNSDASALFAIRERIAEAKQKVKELREQGAVDESDADDMPVFEISPITRYAPAKLIGREKENHLIEDAWAKALSDAPGRPRLMTFVALGGEGKTSLVTNWVVNFSAKNWPGCEAAFAWSFYSQGTRDQSAASSDLFFAEALKFFGVEGMDGQSGYEKGRQLAKEVSAMRTLLILDGLEPLQYAPTSPTRGELKDDGLAALLKGLAANSKGLCLLTTRYSIPDLKAFWETTAPEVRLKRLSKDAGVALLRALGVKGLQKEFETLVEDVKGHALTLNLIGTYLRDAYAGDIGKRDLFELEDADEEESHLNAFRAMDAYVRGFEGEGEKGKRALAILRCMGLFDRPADGGCLETLWRAPAIEGLTESLVALSEAQRNVALTRLEEAKLLSVNRDAAGLVTLDAHPLLRQYFAARLQEERPEAWHAAHKRLYEHLCASTSDRKPAPTLLDLQPLYQAVTHGCQAGLQVRALSDVYDDRICRRDMYYSALKLGAFGENLGAVACFFEARWSRVSPALSWDAQSWLLNDAASDLRALGRLREAKEPFRLALDLSLNEKDWIGAAMRAMNLAEVLLTLGEVAEAIDAGSQAVAHAERGGEAFFGMASRTTHADALYQAGRFEEAAALFLAAEALHEKHELQHPQLYSLAGFRYCDLLLYEAEGAAWRRWIKSATAADAASLAACGEVATRAQRTLIWYKEGWASLLDKALNFLALGRAALYAGLGQGLPPVDLAEAGEPLQAAVDGLRQAGARHYLPCGLLSRAMLLALDGESDPAKADLDEAFDITTRGPMPLHLADVHLHRVRLFGLGPLANKPYPWDQTSPQADLAEARHLIEKHGYWRRKEELEDAERALGSPGVIE